MRLNSTRRRDQDRFVDNPLGSGTMPMKPFSEKKPIASGYAWRRCRWLLLVLAVFFLSDCLEVGRYLDNSGLRAIAENINQDFQPGTPERLAGFVDDFDWNEVGNPSADIDDDIAGYIDGEPPTPWRLDKEMPMPLRQQRYRFPQTFRFIPADPPDAAGNSAIFYRYQRLDQTSSGTIVFLPGFAVSDFAFRFIKRLFVSILEEGWDLVVYVPPFHLERGATLGKDPQYRLFTADITLNVRYQAAMVKEVRTVMRLLRQENPSKPIGGWGGSLGAAILLLVDQWEDWDHAALMIPIVDWNEVLFSEECATQCRVAFHQAGFADGLLQDAYSLISPNRYPLRMAPERVFIQLATHDQLSPASAVEAYAEKHHLARLQAYRASHATVLLSSRVYRDYADFLRTVNPRSSYRRLLPGG
jgi:hypothetical protein